MILALTAWDLAGLAARVLFYLGVTAAFGALASLLLLTDGTRRTLETHLYYGLFGALLAFHGVAVYFLVQVGAAADRGVVGMLDGDLFTFYLQTPVGRSSLARLGGLLIFAAVHSVALLFIARRARPPALAFFRWVTLGGAVGLAVVTHSFRVAGHLAPHSTPVQLALLAHVGAIALWVGTLPPLYWAVRRASGGTLVTLVKRYSHFGMVCVAALLVGALVVAVDLFSTPAELWQSAYGRVLLLKVVPVTGMVWMASRNRWHCLPRLPNATAVASLLKGIQTEMGLAVLVLAITGLLSGYIGPPGH